MNVWKITLAYLDAPLLEASLKAHHEMSSPELGVQKVLVDHCWPINPWNHRRSILDLAEGYGYAVIAPFQNMGAHGGFNWAFRNLPIADDDLVIGADGDSIPTTPGWEAAIVKAMQDPRFGALSLFLDVPGLLTQEWAPIVTPFSDVQIVKPAHGGLEMFDVTIWRASFLKACGGILAGSKYYGFVEGPTMNAMKTACLMHGYTRDYKEILRPFDADPRYQKWKAAHVGGYQGNFDQWLKENEG